MKLKRYKKKKKKENNLLHYTFYLEKTTEKFEELEVTDGIKLGYGVTARKNVNRTTNIRPRSEVSPFARIHIVKPGLHSNIVVQHLPIRHCQNV